MSGHADVQRRGCVQDSSGRELFINKWNNCWACLARKNLAASSCSRRRVSTVCLVVQTSKFKFKREMRLRWSHCTCKVTVTDALISSFPRLECKPHRILRNVVVAWRGSIFTVSCCPQANLHVAPTDSAGPTGRVVEREWVCS